LEGCTVVVLNADTVGFPVENPVYEVNDVCVDVLDG
jgi:hypothetical protein